MAFKEINGQLTASGLKLGIVISRFNSIFTGQLLQGALDCFERHGGRREDITVVRVPGANEIPLVADKLAQRGGFDAILALGAVIRGATPHADLINGQVARSLAKIALDHGLPVINSVISADNLEQAIERSGSKAGNKGWDGALAAIEMVSVFGQLS